MKRNLFFVVAALVTVFLAACGPEQPTAPDVKLVSDKTAVMADGSDTVTFTVIVGDEAVTDRSVIVQDGYGELATTYFTTDVPGTYRFHAVYDGRESNVITVTAGQAPEKSLILSADKYEIYNDGIDETHFTVTYGDEDVTDDASVCNVSGICLGSPVFNSTKTGTYHFKASYVCEGKTLESAPIEIIVKEFPSLSLDMDRRIIYADGTDKIMFTVMLDDEDVTADAVLSVDGVTMASNEFVTEIPGEYEFRAEYEFNGKILETERLTGKAVSELADYDPAKTSKKNVAFFTWTATWCSPCYSFKNIMKDVVEKYGDRVVQVNVHTAMNDAIGGGMALVDIMSRLEEDGRFEITGYPTSFADWRRNLRENLVPTENDVLEAYDYCTGIGAKTGIRVVSSVSNNLISAEITVGACESRDYSLAVFVTEDHVIAEQTGGGPEYDHTNVARTIETDVFGDNLGYIEAGGMDNMNLVVPVQSNWNTKNIHFVVYTLYEEDGHPVVDNVVKAPVGDIFDFEYL